MIWKWGLQEIIRFRWGREGELIMMELVSLYKKITELIFLLSLSLSLCRVKTQQQDGNLQAKKRALTRKLAPWSWTSSLQNCENINFYCLSHTVYSILLWLSKLTKIFLKLIGREKAVLWVPTLLKNKDLKSITF